jgi:DNA-binding transcriptional LysR family regulator
VEIQQLRHLIAAVEQGNLLKAADACNISQSGLSRSIKSLETRLGIQLLIRKSKGVEPTIYGLSVMQRARLILNEVGRSYEEVRAIQAADIGQVTFGITQNYAHYFIPDVLAELHGAKGGVRVVVVTGGFLELVEQLREGALDFAFGLLGPIEENSELIIEPLRDHHSRVIARREHPLAAREDEISPQDLALARWATLRGEGFQKNFTGYFASRGLKAPAQTILTDSIDLIRQVVARVNVLSVLPPDIVLPELQSGAFAILDCEAPAEQTQVGLLFRKDAFVTPQMKQMVDRIRKRLSR